MDSEPDQKAADGMAGTAVRVLIAVPFYKNEHLVAQVVGSLIRCADDLTSIGAEVALYDDSPEYPPLLDAMRAILPSAQAAFPCRLVRNAENLGFVRTMNLAVAEAVDRRCDLVILNSDTRVEPGALTEMLRVLRLDHMIGFVNPRSNNATIATLPIAAMPDDNAALLAYRDFAARLPPVSYVPTAVGFCMAISWRVLAEFGGFDPIYGKGYNEENDLVMRAGRCGFRAVLANHAFVWHAGEQSFAVAAVDRSALEPVNRAILDSRYPEYVHCTQAFYHAPETLAERLLAATTKDSDGKRNIAFDFSSFRPAHNGTFVAGRQLLSAAPRVWGEGFRLHVLCSQEVYDFHEYAALGVPRVDPHGGMVFAAVFRVGQPYEWNAVERITVSGAVIGIYMLDTISIDCQQLTSQFLYNMWQFTLDAIDVLATQSGQTDAQFAARFRIPASAARVISMHSLDLADYALPVATKKPIAGDRRQPRILVLGNHFHHKFVAQTANALAAAFPGRTIVALGQAPGKISDWPDGIAPPSLNETPNLIGIRVGELSDADIGAQYAAANVVIFPSHAEGFGIPVLNALAAQRPVLLRRLPVFEEIWRELGQTPNIIFYETTQELVSRLADMPRWVAWTSAPGNGAERSAEEIKAALDAALHRTDYNRIVQRIRAVQLVSSFANRDDPADDDRPAKAARHAVARAETVLRRLLNVPVVYKASRLTYRSLRPAWRLIYRLTTRRR